MEGHRQACFNLSVIKRKSTTVSLIQDSTAAFDRKYVASDIEFTANYLGLEVLNTRFAYHRAITGRGVSIEVRESEVFVLSAFTGLFQHYLYDLSWNSYRTHPLAVTRGIGKEPLFQLVNYLYKL